jgi:hypothetical protein
VRVDKVRVYWVRVQCIHACASHQLTPLDVIFRLNTRYVLSESVVPILQAFCYSDSDSPYPQCNQDGGIAHDNTVYGLVMRALWAIAGGTHSQYVVSDDIEFGQNVMASFS